MVQGRAVERYLSQWHLKIVSEYSLSMVFSPCTLIINKKYTYAHRLKIKGAIHGS